MTNRIAFTVKGRQDRCAVISAAFESVAYQIETADEVELKLLILVHAAIHKQRQKEDMRYIKETLSFIRKMMDQYK